MKKVVDALRRRMLHGEEVEVDDMM